MIHYAPIDRPIRVDGAGRSFPARALAKGPYAAGLSHQESRHADRPLPIKGRHPPRAPGGRAGARARHPALPRSAHCRAAARAGSAVRLGGRTAGTRNASDRASTAAQHGNELLLRGFTVGQVVHDYGDLCQAITDVAVEQNAAVPAAEFRTLNWCLDNAIADAVTEFGRQHEELASDESTRAANERLGALSHEIRNLVHRAILAVATIKQGSVGLSGATGALLDRSLTGLRDLVDRALVDVRLTAGLPERRERIVVADFVAEAQLGATHRRDGAEPRAHRGAHRRGPGRRGRSPDPGRGARECPAECRQVHAAPWARVAQHLRGGRSHPDLGRGPVRRLAGGKDARRLFRPFEQAGADRTALGWGCPSAGEAWKPTGVNSTCTISPARAASSPSICPARSSPCSA